MRLGRDEPHELRDRFAAERAASWAIRFAFVVACEGDELIFRGRLHRRVDGAHPHHCNFATRWLASRELDATVMRYSRSWVLGELCLRCWYVPQPHVRSPRAVKTSRLLRPSPKSSQR